MLSFLIVFDQQSKKILRKNQSSFRRKRSMTTDFDYPSNPCRGTCLYLEAKLENFSKAFSSIQREKVEQILRAYWLLKETISAMIILYKNTKTILHSLDRDTNFFEIVAEILQEDTLPSCMLIICLTTYFEYP